MGGKDFRLCAYEPAASRALHSRRLRGAPDAIEYTRHQSLHHDRVCLLKSMTRHLILCLLLVAWLSAWSWGADHYVWASAAGSGTGANCTNAYTGFGTGAGQINPASMTRGDTYWVGAGSYGNVAFTTSASGSSVITIEAMTAANHGSASDCGSAYASASSQATFIGSSDSSFSTNYWTMNGQAVAGCTYPSNDPSCYNIRIQNTADCNNGAINFPTVGSSNYTLDYLDVKGTGTGVSCPTGNGDLGFYAPNGHVNNLYVGHSYVHETGNTQFQFNYYDGAVSNNHTYEYNWVYFNHASKNGTHDEAYSCYCSNLIVRYSVFQDITWTGIITDAGSASPAMSNWEVYGNLFFWDSAYATNNCTPGTGLNGGLAQLQDGIVAFLGETMSGHIYFYNNTMAGIWNGCMDDSGQGASTLAISGSGSSGTVTVVQENNLWVGSGYATGDYTEYCAANGSATCTHDYDAFYQNGITAGDFTSYSEAHGYTVSGSTNPFVNIGASTIAGFEPSSPDPFASHAGTSLSSPYNTDMLGVIRGANGTWDRGALQISGSSTTPTPPTGLTAIVH